MSGDSRDSRAKRKSSSKVYPIKPDDLSMDELPFDLDAERLVLGAVLMDDSRFSEIAHLTVDDFSFERHRRAFGSMRDLHHAGDAIDRITVANRLKERNEANPDDFSFLVDLDTGIPQVLHLTSWCRILREKSVLRRASLESHRFRQECSIRIAAPAELLASHHARIEVLNAELASAHGEITRIEDLESVFADRTPVEYVIEPELPTRTVVSLAGDSESGKTTLACAWARDALAKGHAVLLLDRDKNPRERIRDRLERLGIPPDCKLLSVWDCQQSSDPPQPNDPRVIDWVKRMLAETGKSPLVIGDSLVSFLMGDEDENSAKDMRAVFDRFRAVTSAGGTGNVLHHLNRNGEARGSSDFKPAGDQGFLVSNNDRGGGRLLDVITLTYTKSRYGLAGTITYYYDHGRVRRGQTGTSSKLPEQTDGERLQALLMANPGILGNEFEKLAGKSGLTRKAVREFLKQGESDGTIKVEEFGRSRRHFWRGREAESGDQSP